MTRTIFDTPTLSEQATKAQEVFHRNADTLIAGFLVRNPDVNPEDVELVFQSVGGVMRFSIEPKELHVPPVLGYDNATPHRVPPEHQRTGDTIDAYVAGWNACRDAMIAQAKSVRAPEAIVSTLGAADV